VRRQDDYAIAHYLPHSKEILARRRARSRRSKGRVVQVEGQEGWIALLIRPSSKDHVKLNHPMPWLFDVRQPGVAGHDEAEPRLIADLS